MSFLRRLLGGSGTAEDGPSGDQPSVDEAEWRTAHEATFDATGERHRVTLWLRLADPAFENVREQQRLFALENALMRALDGSGAGEHDSNSLETGYLAIRLIGGDADGVLGVISPLLSDVPPGSYLAVRRGPAGTGEDRIELGRSANDTRSPN